MFEWVYEECLFYELQKAGLIVERQKSLTILYDDLRIENAFKVDLLVDHKVVIEIKSVESMNNLHFAQLNNYLKVGNYKLGMLINFNSQLFKNGVKRVVNGLNLSLY